jgi:stearoyl-CoA desaturase (delta-9 desaturase)
MAQTAIIHEEIIEQRSPLSERIDWVTSTPFVLMHVAAVVGLFVFPITFNALALCIGLYYARMWAVTTAYHRYFSHRSFKTSRWFQFVLALIGSTTLQKGVLWWAAHHRDHHRFSDMPEDIHSPVQRGFWWSHVGWIMAPKYEDTKYDRIRDFTKYPELVWLNTYWIVPIVLYSTGLYLFGGWSAFYWGFVVSSVILWHGTFTVNSLAHVWGKRRYKTGDDSRNNFWIALITMGEGWHNNHHYYQVSARQGFFWWEVDASYYILKVLEKAGIVWDLRVPSEDIRNSNRT